MMYIDQNLVKVCFAYFFSLHYEENKEHKLEYQKLYAEENKEKIVKHQKEYRENNIDKLIAATTYDEVDDIVKTIKNKKSLKKTSNE